MVASMWRWMTRFAKGFTCKGSSRESEWEREREWFASKILLWKTYSRIAWTELSRTRKALKKERQRCDAFRRTIKNLREKLEDELD